MIGKCDACPTLIEIIEDLREQLADTQKSLLFLVDARAAALRFPAERPAAPTEPAKPPMTQGRARGAVHVPKQTPEDVERLFELESDVQRRIDADS